MQFMDPHIHIASRTTDDLQALARAGCVVVAEPAFWMGYDRSDPRSFAALTAPAFASTTVKSTRSAWRWMKDTGRASLCIQPPRRRPSVLPTWWSCTEQNGSWSIRRPTGALPIRWPSRNSCPSCAAAATRSR